jgi:hypothetical protein
MCWQQSCCSINVMAMTATPAVMQPAVLLPALPFVAYLQSLHGLDL